VICLQQLQMLLQCHVAAVDVAAIAVAAAISTIE